ncbi:MAG: 5-amino-6-(D-ribitylamino)uracil--L-tyrosine 4-hydroxyphenyl transferase CofH [Nitrosopumilaceae archaeon]|jgi:FO synthase subunit 2|uniref:5-amino-6-(D-ribitylamino)uracil--L-tyrosine 4-hydroxyphenyl transferase CofH n=3 Tax=Candidatus Nitrosomaritimum aestuariumsis TaxID=3342354 RepID=A0AC60W4A2_9ARCH|nr:5-amino-6-(D-ribitylamino)uracil--L-tyrosine 4-hydroxyphenyl transferase CofH [Nitrosopumilaceae archaeon]MBA4454513.1 5-amino-6-(D-ribitylamino)uracil--L-tyrosine 4-hydroxyphenyl transferase CofH [Nitrosopumilaceae archaeon]MBA4459977.1 5-amino-6-(D-ribitylamino)uracil--L-tyrosine 4-hydroxyphenyl transferase CofH [Nitrosopumilaceae archaeon]MBA4461008.1 5-amino-6-(D-ribitylamino)uracil--L-tyrosine 4-hydroxyphenyl transferase CofH [Nitrosopumilaceae archaeon]MBA4463674.1 5-amino-6-(D-ribityl
MSVNIDSLFRNADPVISDILNRTLSEKEISAKDGLELYNSDGMDFHLIGLVADEIRRRRVGNIVTYVVNRNINFTNVCIKQCGFCAFSRDFREEEGYFLPTEEIVRRAKEAHQLGATEVCIQAGLPPDMEGDVYENICRAIKNEIPDIHIHGFSPEEVLYGATRSNTSIDEYLKRLKESGVDTLPGTAAEILDQKLRDKISPGRISVKDWVDVIKTAHKIGINTTSTMMFGHLETPQDRVEHIAKIREIQKETGGFTEFVPLDFIHSEAPMYKHELHEGIKQGGSGKDVLLTHAIARIMLNNYIDNIQMSWVKEGQKMSQLLLMWGANDFGGTLINESISTSAGSEHGQLLRPKEIKRVVREIGRIPAERNTKYKILKRFDIADEHDEELDKVKDVSQFGSYVELIKIDKYKYKNPRNE